jgi:hypothetical protein
MKGVRIGEKHTHDDFGLILSSKVISPPTVQTKLVTVPLRDGAIDLTEAVSDVPRYNDRIITMTFSVLDPMNTWTDKVSEIQNYMHGKRLNIIFDDDLAFYYVGRVTVDKWSSNKNIGTLVIKAEVEPFKYTVESSAVDWEWDVFDFESGIINETGQLIVNGSTTINLICRQKRVFPTITASSSMTVTYNGETHNLRSGSQKLYDMFLVEGNNELTFTGNGTVSIDYIGGSL